MKVSSWDHGPVRCLQLDQPGVLFWPLTEDIREYSRSVSQGRASPDGECLSEGLPRRAGLLGSECPPPRSVDSTMVNSTTPTFHLYNILIHTLHTAHQTQTFANIFFEVKGTKSYHWFSEPCCAYTLQDNQCETEWNHIFNWEASDSKNMSENMSGVRLDSVPHLDITESLLAPANSRQRHWRVRGGESKLF